MKFFLKFTMLLCFVGLLSSCGYHIGSIAHPQIKTIAIAPIKNETYVPNGSDYMRMKLSEAFQKDGSWKIKNMDNADCVLYGRILQLQIGSVTLSTAPKGYTYITSVFSVTITFEYTVIVPGRAKPLIPTTQVTETMNYQSPGDYYTAQQEALQQVCYQAALDVVSGCTETW